MKYWKLQKQVAALALWLACLALPAGAENLQLISTVDPAQGAPSGGSGDSWAPVLSADGRYVLFASTANNLLLATNGQPIPARIPAPLNVYLRDRTNGTTSLVSVNLSGVAGGNGDSFPVDISTNGRYALFESSAGDLVDGDTNNVSDVFMRDLVSGTTLLVSVSTNGHVGNGVSRSSVMTPDGRSVAFVSAANNLVANDTNRIADVFVRDLQENQTRLASAGAMSTNFNLAYGSSEAPDITPDGRFVAFYSTATNLVAGVRTIGDIYVRDLAEGTTIWASSYARTAVRAGSVVAFNHALSADGRYVAYEACTNTASSVVASGTLLRYSLQTGETEIVHTNAAVLNTASYEELHNLEITPDGRYLVFVANTNGTSGTTTCILRWDAENGLNTLVSANLSNQVSTGAICDWPTLDPSGRYVAFLSSATNMVTNSLVGEFHLYLRDVESGTTTLIDADPNGMGSTAISPATQPRLSADGRFIAFDCADSTLAANDRNRDGDVFVRDLASSATELISGHDPALPSLTANGPSMVGSVNALSSDGHYLVFASEANNLAGNDTNKCRDIFARDLAEGTNLLLSVATNGWSGDSMSSEPAISPDGRFVAFTSSADNLVTGDTNKAQDVFVRDLQSGTTTLVSVNSAGTGPGNKDSYSPVVSAGGRYVLFRSKATNLATVPGAAENLFVRDLQAGTTYALAPLGSSGQPATMTPDGRWIAFGGSTTLLGGFSYLYVWDTQAARRLYTNTLAGNSSLISVAITPDGQKLAYAFSGGSGGYLFVANPAAQIATQPDAISGSYSGLRFSADGRYLACTRRQAGLNAFKQIYLYDLQTMGREVVSHRYDSPAESGGNCDAPDLSPDGRFVVYRSVATNLVAGATNGVPSIFLYDRLSGSTITNLAFPETNGVPNIVRLSGSNTLLSASCRGGTANNRSMTPVFSADGQTLAFQSWASDLITGDFNHNGDVVAYTLLTMSVLPAAAPGQGPWICWPVVPGKSYRVQCKTGLTDSDWQDVSGNLTTVGTKRFLQDLTPPATQKFYRVVAY